jgi:hypothetical protein
MSVASLPSLFISQCSLAIEDAHLEPENIFHNRCKDMTLQYLGEIDAIAEFEKFGAIKKALLSLTEKQDEESLSPRLQKKVQLLRGLIDDPERTIGYKRKAVDHKALILEHVAKKILQISSTELSNAIDFVSRNGFNIRDLSEDLQSNEQVAWAAVNNNGDAYQYLPLFLQRTRNIAYAAVRQNGLVVRLLDPMFQTDKEIMLVAAKENGKSLKDMLPEFQNDFDIVKTAVCRSPSAICYASFELQQNSEIRKLSKAQESMGIRDLQFPLMNEEDEPLLFFAREKEMSEEEEESLKSSQEAEKRAEVAAMKRASEELSLRSAVASGKLDPSEATHLPMRTLSELIKMRLYGLR